MLETIIWFTFRDSRVKIPLIKPNPGPSLIVWFLIQMIVTIVLFVAASEYEHIKPSGWTLFQIKIYCEAICTAICIPFFIYKGFKTVDLNRLTGS